MNDISEFFKTHFQQNAHCLNCALSDLQLDRSKSSFSLCVLYWFQIGGYMLPFLLMGGVVIIMSIVILFLLPHTGKSHHSFFQSHESVLFPLDGPYSIE